MAALAYASVSSEGRALTIELARRFLHAIEALFA